MADKSFFSPPKYFLPSPSETFFLEVQLLQLYSNVVRVAVFKMKGILFEKLYSQMYVQANEEREKNMVEIDLAVKN